MVIKLKSEKTRIYDGAVMIVGVRVWEWAGGRGGYEWRVYVPAQCLPVRNDIATPRHLLLMQTELSSG